MKRCSRCGETKPRTEFYRVRRTPARGYQDGLDYNCRQCDNARSIAYQRRNQGRIQVYRRRQNERRKRERARARLRRSSCGTCQDGEHGPLCLGPAADCGCRCRAMLGLEGPFEFGDPTVPGPPAEPDEGWVA